MKTQKNDSHSKPSDPSDFEKSNLRSEIPPSATLHRKKRTGKVAELPVKVRAWVNEALADEIRYEDILAGLEAKGFPGFTIQHLNLWHLGGHKEWLLRQERLEMLQTRTDAAVELTRDFKEKDAAAFGTCNQLILLSQINNVLQDYDPQCLKLLLEEKPELFLRLASMLNAQASERTRRDKLELELQKYRDQVAEQKRKIQQALDQTQIRGLTPEVLAQIEEAARLL